jgi:hypothetical protein
VLLASSAIDCRSSSPNELLEMTGPKISSRMICMSVLLAYDEGGIDLCSAGPRLVVPGDIKGGRYVSSVVNVHVGRAG